MPPVSPLETSEEEVSSFERVYARLKLAVGAESDAALAAALEIKQGSIGVAKRRRQIPPNWIEKISKKFKTSADWLYFGQGSMRRGYVTGETACETARVSYIDPAVQLVDEAVKETGISVNERQKIALVEIVREEMKSKAADILKAMRGA